MQLTKRYAGILVLVFITAATGIAQEKIAYSKNGLSFDYPKDWEIKIKAATDADEVGLANTESDSQVTVIVLNKPLDTKKPEDVRKRVIDPWLNDLQRTYEEIAKVKMFRTETTTTVAGQTVQGADFSFIMDNQPGKVQACWVMFDKQLVLLYMVRPNKTAEKANKGWDAIRESMRFEKKK